MKHPSHMDSKCLLHKIPLQLAQAKPPIKMDLPNTHICYNYMHKISLQWEHCILVLPFAIHNPLACFQPGHNASGKRRSAGPGPRIPFWSLILPSPRGGGSICPSFSSSLQPGACHSLYNIMRNQVKQNKWTTKNRKDYEGPSPQSDWSNPNLCYLH